MNTVVFNFWADPNPKRPRMGIIICVKTRENLDKLFSNEKIIKIKTNYNVYIIDSERFDAKEFARVCEYVLYLIKFKEYMYEVCETMGAKPI